MAVVMGKSGLGSAVMVTGDSSVGDHGRFKMLLPMCGLQDFSDLPGVSGIFLPSFH
jgi:hypothetical protein